MSVFLCERVHALSVPPETANTSSLPVCCLGYFAPTHGRGFTQACLLIPVDLLSYVTRFQWDRARYPPGLPLSSLTELISKVRSHCQATKSNRVIPIWSHTEKFYKVKDEWMNSDVTYLPTLRVYIKNKQMSSFVSYLLLFPHSRTRVMFRCLCFAGSFPGGLGTQIPNVCVQQREE